jgi:cytidylate kinase
MVIAIDGPAGSGKSTIAKLLTMKLRGPDGRGYTYINSGNLYRAITLGCMKAKINVADLDKVLEFAQEIKIEYHNAQVFLYFENVTECLHTDEIDRFSAPLSAIVPVRRIVNGLIRSLADNRHVVAEGRDMTTVVFPNAEHRFYLDASADSRARRRFEQGVSGLNADEIRKAILQRDEIDKNKIEGNLKIADGVHYLDTSDLTIMQVYEKLIETVNQR